MKTSELTGAALRYAVALALDWNGARTHCNLVAMLEVQGFRPDLLWGQGGPIIERECVELTNWGLDGWCAKATNYQFLNTPNERDTFCEGYGPTPLIAAMRCFVASKLGDEVDVPKELL